MPAITEGKILVTGATGPVGASIVLGLVAKGYTVRATSRSQKKVDAWRSKHPELDDLVKWLIVKDMADEGSLDDSADGVDGVIHCAGPFHWLFKTAPEYVTLALNGTQSVLRSCAKPGSTVKRLLLVSSIAAMTYHDFYEPKKGKGITYNEKDWNAHTLEAANTTEFSHNHYGYTLSKKLAEQAAVKFMETEHPNFDLVRLCPATGYGPLHYLTPEYKGEEIDAGSNRLWQAMTTSETIPENPWTAFIHHSDTADAAIKALETPEAGGQRYLLVGGHYNFHISFRIIANLFPELRERMPEPIRSSKEETFELPDSGDHYDTDVSKAEGELGMKWRTLEDALKEQIPALRDFYKK